MSQKTADSDVRMMIATQVAYLDGDKGMSVGDLVKRTISNYGGQSNLSEREQAQLDTAQYIQSKIQEYDLYDCNRWVIKEVADDNARSGFYGCLIDTRDGEAIVGFRGSESFDTGQIINDWGRADLGLLNAVETTQQQRAEEFTQFINNRYGDFYHHYNFAGHSLGGNLAEHATITAPKEMPVYRCVNLDGPGYSDEYIIAHSIDIERQSQYIDHFQYSVVGSLLLPLPGTNYQTIAAHNDEAEEGLSAYLFRHHTRNIEFDENGTVRQGERDMLANFAGPLSQKLELADFNLLMLVSPTLGLLKLIADNGYAILFDMKNRAEQVVESIQTTLEALKQSVKNWFRSMFGVALTGEYELNISYVNALGDGLNDAAQKLYRISGNISDISNKLRYSSLAGSYDRSKLRSLSRSVGRDRSKVLDLSNAVCGCAQCCVDSDLKVGQLFETV